LTNYQSSIKLSVILIVTETTEVWMDSYAPAELTDCTVELGPDEQRAVRDYWEQVVREEEIPVSERVYCPPSLEELDERRSRRQARRGLASVTRLARVRRAESATGQFSPGPEAA
jgi:hypothetical protein